MPTSGRSYIVNSTLGNATVVFADGVQSYDYDYNDPNLATDAADRTVLAWYSNATGHLGVQVQDVNRLLKQFMDMQRMMKSMKGGKLKRLLGALKQ